MVPRSSFLPQSRSVSLKRRNTRRGLKKKPKDVRLVAIGCNAAGLKQKVKSLESKVEKLNPGCVFLQETKLYKKGQIAIDGFEPFEQVRDAGKGGGLLSLICKSFDPVLVYEGDDDIELLVVQGTIGKLKVRFINAYGPQEDDTSERIMSFYEALEEQIISAFDNGCGIIMECDANAKLGWDIIKNDPNAQSNNGVLLWSLVSRNNLTVVNSLDVCNGTITRKRVTKIITETAVLDYFIVCDRMLTHVTKMEVDEKRVDILTKYAGKKGNGKLVESDHNLLIMYFDIHYEKEVKNPRIEFFDFNNLESQQLFFTETSHNKLTNCFRDGCSVEENSQRFEKVFTRIVHKCFKKVRLRPKKVDVVKEKLKQLDKLKTGKHNRESIEALEEEIQQTCAAENARIIREQVEQLLDVDGNFSPNLMWKVKSKVCKRVCDPPMAKKDNKGNLITAPSQLKQLYIDEYVHRLRHREIKSSLDTLKTLKEDLWDRTFKILCESGSPDWTTEDVEKVLTKMKGNKSRDPLGFANELFKPGVCGPDLISAITLLANSSKNQVTTPSMLKPTNVSTIYKNKGSRFYLVNDRGIFNLVTFRKIIDRLIYNDKYDSIDQNMSCSNVGGRKKRNIRNHLFIVYGVINSVMNNESPPVDLQFYDLKQCFDAMWLEESMNDLCDSIPFKDWDNKLALVYQNNCENHVGIKTPFGLTDRVDINRIVTQGGVWGPIQCSNQVDKLGKECVKRNIHLYTYKETVKIMPLAMIDDILAIALCGFKSVATNTFVNCKMEMKKLLFSDTKCKHVHVGKECPFCPVLEVHGKAINRSTAEKYLGDIIAESIVGNGCNNKNIENRRKKGLGLVAQVMSLLDSVSLGYYLFETAMILRESIFLNGIMCNSEAWYSLTKKQIKELEDVDKLLLRRILQAPVSTPGEALYLETGAIPISFILKRRRLMFLHYMLNLNESEMLSQFFYAQWNNPCINDWTITIKKDLDEFNIEANLDIIKSQSQYQFKNLVKERCCECAFQHLITLKETHSKLSGLSYEELMMQPYLCDGNFHSGDARILFRFRTRMVRVGNNYRAMYSGQSDAVSVCPLCQGSEDTQEHLLECPNLGNDGISVRYSNIFSMNTTEVKETFEILKRSLNRREDLIDSKE